MRDFGLEQRGAIAVETVDITLSAAAQQAEREAPGDPADALVWESLEQRAGEETRLSVSYLAFMVVATIIASVGVMLDQPILIVGAMVVGPEFGPLVALLRRSRRSGSGPVRPGAGDPDPGLRGRHDRHRGDHLDAGRDRARR